MEKLTELENLLDQLKTAREYAQSLRDERKKLIEQVQATDTFKALSEAGNKTDELVTELEDAIRNNALEVYKADAAIPTRTSIYNKTVVNVPNPKAAKEWALHNFTPGLKIDEKAFETAAKSGSIPDEIATVLIEPTIRIATKL